MYDENFFSEPQIRTYLYKLPPSHTELSFFVRLTEPPNYRSKHTDFLPQRNSVFSNSFTLDETVWSWDYFLLDLLTLDDGYWPAPCGMGGGVEQETAALRTDSWSCAPISHPGSLHSSKNKNGYVIKSSTKLNTFKIIYTCAYLLLWNCVYLYLKIPYKLCTSW